MNRFTLPRLPGTVFAALVLLVAGCGEPDAAPAAGAHGGVVAVLGDHAAHLETVHDEAAGAVMIWVSDTDMAPTSRDEAPVLSLVTDAGSVRVAATAHEGGSRFAHDALKGHSEGARFQLRLGAAVYTPDLPCDHEHEHGTAGDHEH